MSSLPHKLKYEVVMSYKASAPANLMIIGEYAVINGHPAVVCAVNARLHVTVEPKAGKEVYIHSALGEHTTNTIDLQGPAPFDLALACLKQFTLPSGCNIVIESEFSHTLGLGSSAAFVAALCHALAQWTEDDYSNDSLWNKGIAAIRSLSQHASGADLAASLTGGVLVFKNDPFYIEPIRFSQKLSVIYSGSKLESKEAVLSHKQKQTESPKFIASLEGVSNQLVTEFIVAVEDENWEKAGEKLNAAHGLLHTLGVSNERLDTLTWLLRESDCVYGAKISGSGLGDCVIGLGLSPSNILTEGLLKLGCQQLPLEIEPRGVINES